MPKVLIQSDAFDAGAELAALCKGAPGAGGLGCFIGVVRGDGALRALTLEHYPGMTSHMLDAIVAEAGSRWPLLGVTVIHRIGRLLVNDPIVLVCTAAAHRGAAIDSMQFLIDRLKTDAPFWKLEEMSDGRRRWVEPRVEDAERTLSWLDQSVANA